MFNVTDGYKVAISQNKQITRVTGVIQLKDGSVMQISDSNIKSNSLSVASQCVDRDDFNVGCVNAKQVNLTLLNITADPYIFNEAIVTLDFGLKVGEDFETVPLGVFNVYDPSRKFTNLTLKALDNMFLFGKSIKGIGTSGTMYELTQYCCEKCEVTFGMTEEEVASLPCGTFNFTVPSSSEIETCIDLISWIAQLLGCFATCDRNGHLIYKQLTGNPVTSISGNQKNTKAVADFKAEIAGVSMGIAGRLFTRVDAEKSGRVIELDENPLIRTNTDAAKNAILDAVLSGIIGVEYTPFDIDYTGDPALDVGDYITLDGNNEVTGLITKSNWRYRAKQSIQGQATDPRINTKLQSVKKINSISDNTQYVVDPVYYYENASPFEIGTDDTRIIVIKFNSVVDANPIFHANIVLNIENGGMLEFTYKMDGGIHRMKPLQSVQGGMHTQALYLPMPNTKGPQAHEFEVFLKSATATGTIGKQQIQATINGQGLEAKSSDWDGVVKVDVDFEAVPANLIMCNYSSATDVNTQTPTTSDISVAFDAVLTGYNTFGNVGFTLDTATGKPVLSTVSNIGNNQIKLTFTNQLIDINLQDNLDAIYITGSVGGIAKQWLQDSLQLVDGDYGLLVSFPLGEEFDNADGNLRVQYDSLLGNLTGAERVNSFDLYFAPTY